MPHSAARALVPVPAAAGHEVHPQREDPAPVGGRQLKSFLAYFLSWLWLYCRVQCLPHGAQGDVSARPSANINFNILLVLRFTTQSLPCGSLFRGCAATSSPPTCSSQRPVTSKFATLAWHGEAADRSGPAVVAAACNETRKSVVISLLTLHCAVDPGMAYHPFLALCISLSLALLINYADRWTWRIWNRTRRTTTSATCWGLPILRKRTPWLTLQPRPRRRALDRLAAAVAAPWRRLIPL